VKPKPDFLAILQTLATHQVDFIVVGGVGAVLQGAPISTFDLDLVHSRTRKNVDRLLVALELLDARYRTAGAREIKPARSHLSSPGHQLLMTRFGPLDLLGAIGKGQGYEDLLGRTVNMKVGTRLSVRVLDLEMLVKVKQEVGRAKDRAVLAVLQRTLEEKSKSC
jgi:hypothetical protein